MLHNLRCETRKQTSRKILLPGCNDQFKTACWNSDQIKNEMLDRTKVKVMYDGVLVTSFVFRRRKTFTETMEDVKYRLEYEFEDKFNDK
jgi:hypothetical protein